MAQPSFRAPIGTRDVLPPESRRWELLVAEFAHLVGRAGYGLVQSPMFEDIEVFSRVGETTDIVSKEMYEFDDKGGRRIALRPEGTAPVVRAWVQHRPPLPFKAWYVAPSFRYERPQAGRYRQHHQLGIEALGVEDPDLDVEVISLAWDSMSAIGLNRVVLLLNSLGDPASRDAYRAALVDHFAPRRGDLNATDRQRLDQNPLRLLDSKDPDTLALVAGAPTTIHLLNEESRGHFDRVQEGLRALDIPFVLEPRLVRGLDYYTHTLFELQASALEGAQNAVGGGGRYDGLVEALGGPPTPGVGFGLGIERMLLAAEAERTMPEGDGPVQVFVVDTTDGSVARNLTHQLRRAGVGADRAWGGRSMKAQFKAADRSGARLVLVVGDDEVERGMVAVRDLRGGDDQIEIPGPETVERVKELLTR
jgi:histidyl-tRNA synthetase